MSHAHHGRRQFLGGLLAASLIPRPTWADVGAPAYLAAAALPDGAYVLCAISHDLDILFQIPLPARGHAAAAHPTRPEAVAFARRPGTFAVVVDCAKGRTNTRLEAPQGRHFYGHGTFSADGSWLFTTENDYEAARGVIGVWDVAGGYARAGEFASGGVGPHDIKRLPASDVLVVANGGIETHPDSGRTKLNIATMAPNLGYLEDGALVETAELPNAQRRNSIRHLAVSPLGLVGFGMQWQSSGTAPALVGTHRRGGVMTLMQASEDARRAMQAYVGSVAFATGAPHLIATSPRGGIIQNYDVENKQFLEQSRTSDASGVAPNTAGGVVISSGDGSLSALYNGHIVTKAYKNLRWDNHLVQL